MNQKKFKKGDIVTRDGSDEQIVLEDEDGYNCISVRCIKAPIHQWMKVGETEYNLARRYKFVKKGHKEEILDFVGG